MGQGFKEVASLRTNIKAFEDNFSKIKWNDKEQEKDEMTTDTQSANPELLKRFGPYRKPTEVTIPKYQQIQEKALEMAMLIDDLCPHSQQKSSALTLLEQCKMSANAAIAIHS